MCTTEIVEKTSMANGMDKGPVKQELVWRNIVIILILHILAVYGYYLFLTEAKTPTLVFYLVCYATSAWGLQIGTHRLWSHRSYKARPALQLLLAYFQTMGYQSSIYQWCWDHRTHHKYSDTDADPHNASRGFFYSHIGWFMCRRHPASLAGGHTVDMSDLKANPIIMFQHKYYLPLALIAWAIVPTLIPYYMWNENPITAFMVCVAFRWMVVTNCIFLVNSAAHLWGHRPYDKSIKPVECSVRYMMYGEGYHNYHHAFPWDYACSELGPWDVFNPGAFLIEFFERVGWAYDLKRAPRPMIAARVERSGDPKIKRLTPSFCDVLLGCLFICLPFWPIWANNVYRLAIQLLDIIVT